MIKTLLEFLGIVPNGLKRDREIADASTEDAVRDNDKAFAEIKQVYKERIEKSHEVKEKLEKVASPFADLEALMRNELRGRRNRTKRQNAAARRSKRYE